jgi:hypothetical protein
MRTSENVIVLRRDVDGLSTHLIIGKNDPEETLEIGALDKRESSKSPENQYLKEVKVQ